jgi:hypothetical protein
MGVEDDGAGRAGRAQFAKDDGRDGIGEPGCGEQLRLEAALAELREEEVGVAAEIGGVGGDVWNGDEVFELLEELSLMRGGVGVGCLGWGLLRKQGSGAEKDG